MKIEIITLHYINHYGSLLQTYATCKMFGKMGHQPEIVDYIRPNADEKIQIRSSLEAKGLAPNSIKGILFRMIKLAENRKRRDFSHRFVRKYIPMSRHYRDYDDLKSDPPIADIYVTGSDQTWNSKYNGGVLPAYYLDFAPEGKKKIGYSVSIGMNEIPDDEMDIIRDYVHQYTAISVRENSAKDLLESLGYKNVTQVLDPTLALTRDDWKPLISRRMIKGKYIIIYKLNKIPEMEEFAKKLALETGCRIVRMSYYLNHFRYKGKMIYSPDVEEFLSLIYYADYVITDSFHCLAFSLNFGKEFYAFYPEQYSTRLKSLMELTDTTARAVKDSSNYSKKPIDYDFVNKVLDNERKRIKDFIKTYCN